MSHFDPNNSSPAHAPTDPVQPLLPAPNTQSISTHEPIVPLIPENIDDETIHQAILSSSPSSPPFSEQPSSTGDASIDLSSRAPTSSHITEASDPSLATSSESGLRSSTPSKSAWTVKGLLSSIKDKVQEPSDASAPVNKFYFDSVNVFQGLHDLSDSDSDGDDAELSPRSDPDSGENDDSMSNDTPSLRNPPRSRNPTRRRPQQNRASSTELVSPAATSKSFHDIPSASFFPSTDGDTLRPPSRARRGSTPSPIPHSFSDSSISPSRRNRSGNLRSDDEEDWDRNLIPLDLDHDESQGFLASGSDDRPERSRQERLARRAAKNKWYQRLWRQVRRQQTWVFLLILGISAAILGLAMEQTMHLLILGRNKLASQTSNYFVNYMLWVLFSMTMCLLAAFLVHFVGPYSAGSGIPAVKSILSGVLMEHYLSFRTLLTKVLGLICVIAAGIFVGKEGPYVHIATALASQLAKLPFFSKIQRNEGLKLQLFAAGCAAGVAVTFGAPIGGVIFSIEVTTTYYLIQNLSKGFFCAIVATLFIKLFDAHGLIRFFSTDFQPAPYTSYELLAFSLIGITFGLLGVLFNKYVKLLAQLRRKYKIFNSSRYGQVLVIAMISALVTFPILPLRSGASSVLNDLFSTSPLTTNWQQPNVYFLLCVVVFLEFIMCGVSVGLPIPCGLYTRMFILGGALGRLVGEVLNSMHILPGLVPAGYAVVGAAAFAAGTTRTLSSSIICFELTRQLEHLLPVLLAVLIASAVGNYFGPSIYDELLKMKGLPYMPPFKSSNTGHRTAKSLMRTDVIFLTTDSTYEDVQNLLIQSHYSSFPLVQSRKHRTLLGVLPRHILERTLDKLESSLSSLAQRQIEILNMALQESDTIAPISSASSPEPVAEHELASPSSPAPTSEYSAAQTTDTTLSSSEELPKDEPTPELTPATPKSVLIEPNFKSRFGALSASLHLDTDENTLPESQKIQVVMQELTRIAMAEKVGFSRSTPGIDAGPFQLPVQTTHSKVHFLFAMLGLNAAYIVDQGELVGVVTKRDLISLQ